MTALANTAAFTRSLLTEDDADKVWCPVRLLFVAGTLVYLGLAIVTVAVLKTPFDYLAFGTGFGGIMGGSGAALFMKAKGGA